MKILNIHGYMGSPENSACSVLRKMGCDVVSPQIDYDSMSPENILGMLSRQISGNSINYIVGTSLGGFFGLLLSGRFSIPAVLVNPCLMPFLTLSRMDFKGDIRSYARLFAETADTDISITSTIIGGNDDVIDYHDFTEKILGNERFCIIPDGKHSGATLPLESYFGSIFKDRM